MKRIDFFLLASVSFLTLFGLFMIYDASSFVAFRDFADKYHYVKDQAFWIVLGTLSLFLFYRIDYHKFYNFAIPILISAIGLLVLVFVPSEFVKLALAIYLAAWFSNKEKGRLWSFLLLLSVVLFLVILEPDMGTAVIILAEGIALYFLSGANVLYFVFLAPVIGILGFIFTKLEPYRAARLATFLNVNQNINSSSYHVRQILIALGSGGLMGVGLGNSLQKYAYLPENTIANHAKDNFGKLLAGGITTFFAAQILINLAAQTALVPLTGIPLPFISYGGSALILNLSSAGILLNIARQGRNI